MRSVWFKSSAWLRSTAWCVLLAFTSVTATGEWLHRVPGSGHAVEVGNGYLLLGIPSESESIPDDTPGCGEAGDSIPVYGEDQCGICTAVAASFGPAASLEILVERPPVDDACPEADSVLPESARYLFRSRAPPAVSLSA